jgi:heterodisulfide reductase subunit C2
MMRVELDQKKLRSDFVKKIEELSGQNLLSCYQCGKCSAGCPMVSAMDILPNQAIRLVQLGQQEDVLKSEAIWLCASCVTCGARCPRGVDLSRIMEALRQIKLRKKHNEIDLAKIPLETLADLPPIALVSCFRKNTG